MVFINPASVNDTSAMNQSNFIRYSTLRVSWKEFVPLNGMEERERKKYTVVGRALLAHIIPFWSDWLKRVSPLNI